MQLTEKEKNIILACLALGKNEIMKMIKTETIIGNLENLERAINENQIIAYKIKKEL